MSDMNKNQNDVKVSVGFWGSIKVNPYDLLISKANTRDLKTARSVTVKKANVQAEPVK